MVQPRKIIAGPAVAPLPYGLQSAALVLDDTDPHVGFGVTFESLNCGSAHATLAACFDDENDDADALVSSDGLPLVNADPFTVYALHSCRSVGGNVARGQEVAERKLDVGFWRGVEEGMIAVLNNADTIDLTPTPGTPVASLPDALGILEEYAAANYVGVPVIHAMRRTVARLGTGALTRQGNRLETLQGAVIASGGGYDFDEITVDGTTAGAGERFMFVTGAVVIMRGATDLSDTIMQQRSDETQTLTEGGAGLTSWMITFDGQTTGAIDDDATAAQVQTALEALSNVEPGDVHVTGGPLGTGPMTVTFGGQYADTNVPQMTTTPTGGTGVVTVATTRVGGSAGKQYSNEIMALAQRNVVAAVECFSAAVMVPRAAA